MTAGTTVAGEIRLNGGVLLSQLQQLGEIGRDHDIGGRTRIALTDAEKASWDQDVVLRRPALK